MRHIHKASVRDRVVHQAVFRALYPIFDPSFIHDSYSCRVKKGTHRGIVKLERFIRKATKNYRKPAHALKCDIKKFFASVDQAILLKIIRQKIDDVDALWLIEKIISSFKSGLPLGNVTSQLFANIYLNELDQFIKHDLKCKYYIRYCDDFVILDKNRNKLLLLLPKIRDFLETRLKLFLHPRKIILRKTSQGIDFLGYIILPHYRILRTKTWRRILKKVKGGVTDATWQSYLGVLKHCCSTKLLTLLPQRFV